MDAIVKMLPIIVAVQLIGFFSQTIGSLYVFLCADILLALNLVWIFNHRLSYLFLIHPFFVLMSSYFFDGPYIESGTGYTYLSVFERYVLPQTYHIDWSLMYDDLVGSRRDAGVGIGNVWAGVIPVFLIQHLMLDKLSDIDLYYSLSLWVMICAVIVANISHIICVRHAKLLMVSLLYLTVSPTSFDINSVLHRYHLMMLGLFLFFTGYKELPFSLILAKRLLLRAIQLVGLLFIILSKPILLACIFLFMAVDNLVSTGGGIFKGFLYRMSKQLKIVLGLIVIMLVQFFSQSLVPEHYADMLETKSGGMGSIANLPLIGIVVRIIYAMLSPFPWYNFDQLHNYGGNWMLFGCHILSALFSTWIIMSMVVSLRKVMACNDELRLYTLYGIAIMSSLVFAPVGFHVYLAPALPFLAPILTVKGRYIPFVYPLGLVIVFEILAQVARNLK